MPSEADGTTVRQLVNVPAGGSTANDAPPTPMHTWGRGAAKGDPALDGPDGAAGAPAVTDGGAGEAVDVEPDLPDVPTVPAGGGPRAARGFRRVAKRVVPMVVGAGIIAVAVASGPGVSAALATIGRMNRSWLVAAVGAEMLVYLWLSLAVRILAGPRVNARRTAPVRIALVLFGLGNVLPAAPAEGLVLAGTALRRRRVDRRRITALLGCSQWFNNRALFTIAALDVLVAAAAGDIPAPYWGGAVTGALMTLILLSFTAWLSLRRATAEWVACLLLRLRYWRDCPSTAVRRERGAAWHRVALRVSGDRQQRCLLTAISAAAWVCDGLCMYLALRAAGVRLDVDQALLAYTAGVIASKVPLIPAGLGVVETVTPLLLAHYGVSWTEAIAAVLVYRLFSTLLPAFVGVIAVVGLRLDRQTGSEVVASRPRSDVWLGSVSTPKRAVRSMTDPAPGRAATAASQGQATSVT